MTMSHWEWEREDTKSFESCLIKKNSPKHSLLAFSSLADIFVSLHIFPSTRMKLIEMNAGQINMMEIRQITFIGPNWIISRNKSNKIMGWKTMRSFAHKCHTSHTNSFTCMAQWFYGTIHSNVFCVNRGRMRKRKSRRMHE